MANKDIPVQETDEPSQKKPGDAGVHLPAKEAVELIPPAPPAKPLRLGEKLNGPLAMDLNDIYTINTNLAGLPWISVPCGFNRERLPIGLQLQAATLDESRLLRTAHQYQQLTSWHRELPAAH